MEEQLEKLIANYAIDLEDELNVSPFEYQYMLKTRDCLAKKYNLLDINQKEKLKKHDGILIQRVKEFYKYLLPIKIWENSNSPMKYWWWHLDKIISNELAVDLTKNQAIYNGKVIELYEDK
jgi:hypothetical protein